MLKKVKIEFGEGKKLNATGGNFTVGTDQSAEGTTPDPLDLFITSLATCAAQYARNFCESRSIAMNGIALNVEYCQHFETSHISKVNYILTLPEGFPEKYKAAMLRAIDLCPVKKHLLNPPAFELELV
ncbi:OsmC family protein [Maridesulfovibrio ferrireducens]|uniref:OsmC family protein n=1 Tax=Maridesulfovibrio ferrireducens TaxID=246191 RepID=UPI001A26F13A|nr:OsmC family protein [Maridesulfovibrio ferrireducens]MBI9111854.1 OsmC family protein [Maridesulfovibrio ferrireducens]